MTIEQNIHAAAVGAVEKLYGAEGTTGVATDPALVQIQKTRKEFTGDYTLVVFPLLKASRKSPDATATEIGEYLTAHHPDIAGFNVIKGFLNLSLKPSFWAARFEEIAADPSFGRGAPTGRTIMVEYSSPNTNKPLHLGHIRNNLLGWSVAEILKECGHTVLKANLVNDRGIHICKSMLAWQKFGNSGRNADGDFSGHETPESSGLKGDHLVGKYYVRFNDELKKDESLLAEAQEMLRKWEARDPETHKLWETMNGWVYDGFEATYKRLGVDFDRMYYESQTYLLGKALVEEGLAKGVFYRRDDGSVWCDLTADGLDEKLLLRADGTSVYMTQDLGTAYRRFADENLDALIYVVGNEQNYHFQVLKLVLKKLGYDWADAIYHLSYGMVELPEGKMKSREGTVVDADDLVEGMVETAREMSAELGKLDGLSAEQAASIAETVGLGALKYFILKVDPRKTMLFDPRESIDFNGNTGPFIQYTHARIRSLLRKATESGVPEAAAPNSYLPEELELIKALSDYPAVVQAAGGGNGNGNGNGPGESNYAPSLIAAYAYDLAKMYNGYYHDHSILKEPDPAAKNFRLKLSAEVAATIKKAMRLLGITVPERM